MRVADIITLIEQQGEQISIILSAFRDRQITSREVIELVIEFLFERFHKEESQACATAQ